MSLAAIVEVGGRPIEVRDLPGTPDAAPLVLLHEGLGSVGLWREFPAQLHAATGRRLIAFSRYGHGHSAPPPHPRTPVFFHEEALEVLPELLSALEVSAPVLVGHSDGASIGLIHAAHHPVAALVLLAPHVFVEDICLTAIRGTRETFASGELRARMARHHDDPDAAFWGWCDVWLDPAFEQWSLEEEAGRLQAPTLLIQGADDPYGTLAQIDRIQARARGPVTRLVLDGGHSPHLEHGPQIAEAVAAFLA
ncbi:MAG TPA: alpha/beta fold hydrolase [Solirubrobacteraceae bacterium]|nr:alpha/beta fold hydrolase [Solirubrobacteraceae bacterium]